MPIRSRVNVLLAEHNVKRAKQGEPALSVRGLARAAGVSHSAIVRLVDDKTEMIQFRTLDRLMRFFDTTDIRDILEYTPDEQA
jgi:DNA-binding Xre family transcriptional regulator